MAYAEHTTVSVERSRAEIERLLVSHGSQQIQVSLDYDRGLARVVEFPPSGAPDRGSD